MPVEPPERPPCKDDLPYQGYDPIAASWKQAPAVNTLWFKNGESQTVVQRIGFSIISLFIIVEGIGFASWALTAFQGADRGWLPVLFVSFAFLFLGLGGLRNALRFPRRPSASSANPPEEQ